MPFEFERTEWSGQDGERQREGLFETEESTKGVIPLGATHRLVVINAVVVNILT